MYLDGEQIPVVKQYKFLGLIFDNKLTFILHIQYLKSKCKKALNVLKVVSHYDWGADRKVLLRLYRALILLRLYRALISSLSLQYALKLKSMPKHPAHNTIFQPKYSTNFADKPSAIPTVGIRINKLLQDIPTIELSDIAEDQQPHSPVWTINQPFIRLDLRVGIFYLFFIYSLFQAHWPILKQYST